MARNITQGQSYPLLDRVADIGTREALRILMDQVNQLRQPASTQDLGGNTITNSGTPTDSTALVPKSYVDSAIEGVRSNLLGSGSSPLDVTALRGQLSQVQRAKLRVNPTGMPLPLSGQPFELLYDTDTAKEYYWNSSTSTWIPIGKGLVGNGVELTAQHASIGLTNIDTVPVDGFYNIGVYYIITGAAGVSSSIVAAVDWLDHTNLVEQISSPYDTNVPGADTRNVEQSIGGFNILTWIDAGTTPQYAVTYASNPANDMQYELIIAITRL